VEIERKFLVRGEPWRRSNRSMRVRQGYLTSGGPTTVRVRVGDEMAWLTVKGPTTGLSREEFECTIPRADGEAMLALCSDAVVSKTRYHLEVGEHLWEVDVFEGANAGLVVAEVELESEGDAFVRPDWLGDEVTFDGRYRNSALAKRPYSTWDD